MMGWSNCKCRRLYFLVFWFCFFWVFFHLHVPPVFRLTRELVLMVTFVVFDSSRVFWLSIASPCSDQSCLLLRNSNSLLEAENSQIYSSATFRLIGLAFSLPLSRSLLLKRARIVLFKTVWCKYRYCRRHNQTFMRESDLGRGSESRSWMCLQLSQTAALLSTPFSPLKPPLCPPLLSLSSLPSSPLICMLLPPLPPLVFSITRLRTCVSTLQTFSPQSSKLESSLRSTAVKSKNSNKTMCTSPPDHR